MTHYDAEQWSDLARGLVDGRQRRRMDEHLAGGCARCGQTLELLQRVTGVAHGDAAQGPPVHVVRVAKALFAIKQPERARGWAPLTLQLAYDSLLEPAPVGTRSGPTSRQLVFHAEDLSLTLRMDYSDARPGREMVLGGEILSRTAGPLSDVPALLMEGDRIIAQSFSGPLGEFHLSYSTAHPPHLRMLLSDDRYIELDLGQRRLH